MIYKKEKTKKISFPLGGIGSGCIGLSGNGELNDWEIFNRPNKNSKNGYSHFAIKATVGSESTVKVLQGDTNECLMGRSCSSNGYYGFGFGPDDGSMAGFPHFKEHVFCGEFPVAKMTFSDEDFPAVVRLCAFNPFIPHNEFDSSLPAAFFEWEIENTSECEVSFAIACTVCNPSSASLNREVCEDGMKGLFLGCSDRMPEEPEYSDLCVLTDNTDTCVQEYWYRGEMKDGPTTYWKDLLNNERIRSRKYSEVSARQHGTVVSYVTVLPHKTEKLRFVIAWNVPVARNYWSTWDADSLGKTWRNYYATQFKNSLATAEYAIRRFDSLLGDTLRFANGLHSCTLPDSVKDAVSSNLSVLKSPTVLRFEDGSFWGWEGCSETVGSCCGTCQHVWNYAYAMPYLFPRLERSIRENTVKYGMNKHGGTTYRVDLPLAPCSEEVEACVDGQMGEIIKFYREWKFSGDGEWMRRYAPSVFRLLEYSWSENNPDRWDFDMDGVMEGRQHHTLDEELFGPNSWLQGFYLLALFCGSEIARFVGDKARAEKYEALYRKGKKWMNENLFNGEYFCHKVDLTDKALVESFNAVHYWNEEAGEIKYQVGEGCIIDQMLADWHAALIGIEGVFDGDKKKIALKNLYLNNYKPSMRNVTNMWRNFSVNDESGTVICTYPEGKKEPAIPITYCEETMTGFEYAFAGLLVAEDYVAEGERIVNAVRHRYDGEKRNPWNEIECGSNYARSMASYALMAVYSGFTFDMREKYIAFEPKTASGKYLFSVCESWGTVEFDEDSFNLTVEGAPMEISSVKIPNAEGVKNVKADGNDVPFTLVDGRICLGNTTVRGNLEFKR